MQNSPFVLVFCDTDCTINLSQGSKWKAITSDYAQEAFFRELL